MKANFSVALMLNYDLYQGGRRKHQLAMLGAREGAEALRYKMQRKQLIVDVTAAYLEIVRQQSLVQISEQTLRVSEDRIHRAESALEFGRNNRLALLQAEVSLDNDSTNLNYDMLQLANAKRILNMLLYRRPSLDFDVEDEIVIVNQELSLDELYASALEKNKPLKLAEQNQRITKIDLGLAKSAHYPQVGFFAGYQYLHQETDLGLFTEFQGYGPTAGIRLSQSIFNGNRTNRQIKAAKASVLRSQLLVDAQRNQLESELINTYEMYQYNQQQLATALGNLLAFQQNFERANEEFNRGIINSTTLREAQLNLTQAQSQIVDFRYQLKVSEIKMLRMAGLLD